MASKYRYKIVVLFYTILHIYMTMALFAINKNTACGYNNIIIIKPKQITTIVQRVYR